MSGDAQEVADLAVKKVFAILGIDINNPASVEEFREDLRFGRRMRKLADHGSMALIGTDGRWPLHRHLDWYYLKDYRTIALSASVTAGLPSPSCRHQVRFLGIHPNKSAC
jgi:hypothetical protein